MVIKNIVFVMNSKKNDVQYSPVAQLVEQAAVNRLVVGSSPTGGALKNRSISDDALVGWPNHVMRQLI